MCYYDTTRERGLRVREAAWYSVRRLQKGDAACNSVFSPV